MGNVDFMHQAVERLREARMHLTQALKKTVPDKKETPAKSLLARKLNGIIRLADEDIRRGYDHHNYSLTNYYNRFVSGVVDLEQLTGQVNRGKKIRGTDIDQLLTLIRDLTRYLNDRTHSVGEPGTNKEYLASKGYATLRMEKKLRALEKFLLKQTVEPQTKAKIARSEIRRTEIVLPSDEVIVETAELLDGLFLPEDLNRWAANGSIPEPVRVYLEPPHLQADLEDLFKQAAGFLRNTQGLSSLEQKIFQGEKLTWRERNTFLIGPELVRRYAPVLLALEQATSRTSRLLVLVKNDAERSQMAAILDPLNNQISKQHRFLIKTPQEARAALKAETLRGLGLGDVDAALLKQLIPDFLPLNPFQLVQWVAQMPALVSLVEKFQALSALAQSA